MGASDVNTGSKTSSSSTGNVPSKEAVSGYELVSRTYCSTDEVVKGRISGWHLNQTKKDAGAECDEDKACKGFHWNDGDKAFVLVNKVSSDSDASHKSNAGDECWRKVGATTAAPESGS